jgi:protein TonB
MMLSRYATSIVVGTVVTLAILFGMQALIATARGQLDESGTRHFVDFVRVEREESLERKDRRREKPTQPDAPPPQSAQPRMDSVDPSQISVNIPTPSMNADISIDGLGMAASDGDYLPIVKIAPQYPMTARTRGIEGYCVVEYTVTGAGTVKDPVVVESNPRGVFDKTSIEAALKFKYRPRVVNGEAIEVRGVRNIFNYKLES